MKEELFKARAYSRALRHLWGTGLEPLTYEPELCRWNGKLLPLDKSDYAENIKHGTEAGYQRERFHHLPICDACRQAKREARRAERARNKLRATG